MTTNTEIKTWQERTEEGWKLEVIAGLGEAFYETKRAQTFMLAEIADLRTTLEAANTRIADLTTTAQRAESEASETWLPVVGFDGLYEVSDAGNIRNLLTGKLISDRSMAGAGYPKASLWKDGQRTQTYFHRVVATAFLGECDGREVNHKNGNKTDNRASNLEWTTRSENVNHSYYVLGNQIGAVIATNNETGESTTYPSVCRAVEAGFISAHIYENLAGKRKTVAGHVFSRPAPPAAVQPNDDPQPTYAEWRKTVSLVQSIIATVRSGPAIEIAMKCLDSLDAWSDQVAEQQPDSGRDAALLDGQLIVGTSAESNAITVCVHVKQGDVTTVVYSRQHSLNGDSIGVENFPFALAAQPSGKAAEVCTCSCHRGLTMHMFPCCGPGSQHPERVPPGGER